MDPNVKLLRIERTKQPALRPVHPSQTKITPNPNNHSPASPASSNDELNDKDQLLVLPKQKTGPLMKRVHGETVCKKYHKNDGEYEERKHVYKTGQNNFEITVKLKKPSKDKRREAKPEAEPDQLISPEKWNEIVQNLREKCKTQKEEIATLNSKLETAQTSQTLAESKQVLEVLKLNEKNKRQKKEIADLKSQLEKAQSGAKASQSDQLRLMQQLKEENKIQRDQIEDLTSQLDKTQSELREYMDTIKELYDLATVLKNENQNLLEKREQIVEEKLASAIAESEVLKKHLIQATQQHELILKPKDEELKKLKDIVNDVKATLEEEINELRSLPVTTSISSAAAAKCSSSTFFRNLNLTDEDDRQSESQKTSISEIQTIDDDGNDGEQLGHRTNVAPKTTNIQNKNQAKRKQQNIERRRAFHDELPSIDDDSSSTQYLYLPISDQNRDFEKDEDFDGLRH